jgi:flagellar hook-associated protein 1 FlgK
MMTQQSALHTTGHNIANANTPGYTRQRVNFEQTEAYPGVGSNAPRIPGQVGTGVKAGSIQRMRESFLDIQYRNENNKVGYWDARYKSLEKMEDLINEPSEDGLNNQIDQLWTALQDLSVDPEDAGARAVVRQRGISVSETFNYLHGSLSAVRDDYKSEIEVTQKEVNSILKQLDNVNDQIRKTEPHGYVTNDLYDEQDRLLDNLSKIIDIEVERVTSGGQPNPSAEGAVTVSVINQNGNAAQLVDGTGEDPLLLMAINFDDEVVNGFNFVEAPDDPAVNLNELAAVHSIDLGQMPRGEMKALIEAYGTENGGLYLDMIADLNAMAQELVDNMNAIHEQGYTLLDNAGNTNTGVMFFELANDDGAANAIKISNAIQNSLNNIAASGDGFAGDGSNARRLANVKDIPLQFGNDMATISSFYQSVVGDMAVNAQEAMRMKDSSNELRETVDYRRQSVSEVSIDEEMTMMIQYQHAYTAAARNITMVDEMLDRIINGMGVVGR